MATSGGVAEHLSGALLVTLMAWFLHQAQVLPPAFLHGHEVRRISAFGVVYFDTMDVCQNVLEGGGNQNISGIVLIPGT